MADLTSDSVVHLCDACMHVNECVFASDFPVLDCVDFDDGYSGPEYPDGDAYVEYVRASLFGKGVVGHEDQGWVCQ